MGHSFKEAKGLNLKPKDGLKDHIYSMWINSRKRHKDYIDCIKEFRAMTGEELKYSKEYVDKIIGNPPWRDESLERKECPMGVRITEQDGAVRVFCHWDVHMKGHIAAPRCYEYPGCNGKFKYKE